MKIITCKTCKRKITDRRASKVGRSSMETADLLSRRYNMLVPIIKLLYFILSHPHALSSFYTKLLGDGLKLR